LIAALGVALLALVVSSFRTALGGPAGDRLADLNVYLGAVHAVQHGTPLYDYAAANGDQFTYPPFALLLFWPFAGLPLGFVQVAWTLATVAAALAIALALVRRAELPSWQRGGIATLTAAVVVLHSAPLHSNLRFGQMSVFVILLALLDALDLVPRRVSGVLIGLAAAIKLTPVLFVPYLWLTGRRQAAIRSLATFGGAASLALALFPSASITFWTHAVFTTSRIGDLAATGNQSLNGTLLRYHLPTTQRTLIWWVLAAAVCTVALLCAREYHRQGRIAYAAVVVGCATIAASPVSWTHHQVWTVLAGLLLVAGGRRAQLASGIALLLVMTLSVGDLVGRLGPGGQFLGDNARMLAALAVCLGGVASVWQPRPDAARQRRGGQRLVLAGRDAGQRRRQARNGAGVPLERCSGRHYGSLLGIYARTHRGCADRGVRVGDRAVDVWRPAAELWRWRRWGAG
jgi:alpha-1,2-mannosyltransferase